MIHSVHYSANNNFAYNSAKIVSKRIKQFIKWDKNASILEFGIGDGRVSADVLFPIFPKDFREYVGTDISSSMVELARKTIPSEKAKLIALDIFKDIPKGFENRFDYIFSFLTMHWIYETRKAIQILNKMLVPGGQIFLSFYSETPNDEAYDILSSNPKWSSYDKILSPFYKKKNISQIYKQHLLEGGFSDVEIEHVEHVHKFNSTKEFKELLQAVNPIVSTVPSDLVNEYLEDYYDALLHSRLFSVSHHAHGDDISMKMKLIMIYGMKK